ncbi:hypothetical protein PEX1_046910 [Penicillium expansum]|nr:hypothetical protein PEX1_046910 [Penicillium expansum]
MATDRLGTQRVRFDLDTAQTDLYDPNVIVSKHFMTSTSNHIFKSNMAKHDVSSEDNSPINTPMPHPPKVTSDDFALAFDIDGVLIKGGEPIPEAVDAMKYINGENPYGVKV